MWLPDVAANFLFAFGEGIYINTTVSRFKRYGLYKPYNLKITLKSRQIILGTKYELLLKNERLFATDLSSD